LILRYAHDRHDIQAFDSKYMKSSYYGMSWYRYLSENRFFLLVIMMLLLVGCKGSGTMTNALPPTAIIQTSLPTLPDTAVVTQVPTQLPAITSSSEYTLAIAPEESASVEHYGLLELNLQTNLQAVNPYDPNEIDLRVSFSAPSGKEVEVGAFWYQDFDFQTRQPKGEAGWKVRFTPDETGEWIAVASAPSLGLHSESISFTVIPSKQPGFVRIHPTNPHYLAFDNGDFFFPIGLNMGWWGGCCDPIDQYGRWFDLFTANGGNTIRVWMAAWSFAIEWKDTGLGDYENRLYEAWLLDQLFQLAKEHGVKIILVLVNHGPFSLATNTEWVDNPYNAALGGPLTSPEQFVSDPVAKAYFQQRLSYIINRWGYSPHLLAWEWFNEVNLTPISDEALIPWLREMTAYLRQWDVNYHLTTNSFAIRTQSAIWQLPELDIAQKHEYSSQINSIDHDLAGRAAQDFQAFAQSMPPKPILLGEFGYSASNYGDDVEKTGIHLHNGLWSTTFSGYAGSGMYWWWDIYIEANNLWKHFDGLSHFLDGEDLTQYTPFSPLQISGAGGSTDQADGLGLRGKHTLVWFRSDGYTAQASVAAREGKQGYFNYEPPLVEGQYLTLDEMFDGDYTVSWYDPQAIHWLDTAIITSQNHTLTVPIPPFRCDLAAKIVRNP